MSSKCERIMTTHRKRRLLRRAIYLVALVVLLTVWLFAVRTWAKTLYVSDTTLEVILRSGPDISHRIIASMPIGARVTMIRAQNGWAEVSLPDGRTGWTLERYLSDRPPSKFTAEKLAKEKTQLESQISEIETSSRELGQENDRIEKELASLTQNLEATSKEYEALKKGATNYLGLQEAHEKLSSELPELKARLAEAQRSHDKLQSSSNMRWFLYGAGVMTLGWIVGLIMGGRRRRRSSDIYR
jgi:SH3 domain protein